MPRKKLTDPIDTILTFCETASIETVQVVRGLLDRELRKRTSNPTAKMRAALVVPPSTPYVYTSPAPLETSAKPKGRRMRASSPRPVNEAAPIVPQQATVGEDDTNANVVD